MHINELKYYACISRPYVMSFGNQKCVRMCCTLQQGVSLLAGFWEKRKAMKKMEVGDEEKKECDLREKSCFLDTLTTATTERRGFSLKLIGLDYTNRT